MKYSKKEYEEMMRVAPIWGFPQEDEYSYKSKMVKTKTGHPCAAGITLCKAPEHVMSSTFIFPAGTDMMLETCVTMGFYGKRAYTCTYCMDYWMEEGIGWRAR